MTTPTSAGPDFSLTRGLIYAARYYLFSRRGLVVLAIVAIIAGVAFNWSWLVATGLAPILLTLLPCAVMCGLGLCMNRLFSSASTTSQSSQSHAAGSRIAEDSALSQCCAPVDKTGTASPDSLKQARSPDERRDPHA